MDTYKELVFELTEEHVKLLRRAHVRWEDCESGAPAINCKRPYGNSDVERDVAKILDWDLFEDQDGFQHFTAAQFDLARRLHEETLVALQIVLTTGEMAPGTYQRSESWTIDWKAAV